MSSVDACINVTQRENSGLPLMALMALGHSVPARRMGPGQGPLGAPPVIATLRNRTTHTRADHESRAKLRAEVGMRTDRLRDPGLPGPSIGRELEYPGECAGNHRRSFALTGCPLLSLSDDTTTTPRHKTQVSAMVWDRHHPHPQLHVSHVKNSPWALIG